MARTTVSIPDDLKRRMERIAEQVNWSHVAAQAFESRLAEIVTRKGAKTGEDVVFRLRASRQRGENLEYTMGFELGEEWARKEAQWIQLERLNMMHNSERFTDLLHDSTQGGYLYLGRGMGLDSQGSLDYWADYIAEAGAPPTPEFIRGFWEGTVRLFRAVRERVEG